MKRGNENGELNGHQPGPVRVLLVEDDPMVRATIRRRFALDGIEVAEVEDGAGAFAAIADQRPDVVVLDLVLPDRNGLSVLLELRRDSDVPVILLSGLADEADRVTGLELGADDYVVKPFSPRELLARVRSVLRRYRAQPPVTTSRIACDGLSIDLRSREVLFDGCAIGLTRLEFDLLAFLAGSPRQAFSRAQLLEGVWGSRAEWQDESTVTEHVHRLRQRVEHDHSSPRHIVTVRGIGYRFEP